jgi:hypothetical protein
MAFHRREQMTRLRQILRLEKKPATVTHRGV